ncbi:hypothetical protein DFJ73DRAFT_863910 [Zopfochytrium polystomum]|nr:hypothetical protein DFJ73DRAFT_863910 [Zopfochytrium polystomum]
MNASDEITFVHAIHALKLTILSAAGVTSLLWIYYQIEVALVARGMDRPPDAACLYYSYRLCTATFNYFIQGQHAAVASSGKRCASNPVLLFLLIDLAAIAATCAFSPTKAIFFGIASVMFVPGAFCGAMCMIPRELGLGARILISLCGSVLVMAYINSTTWFVAIFFYVLEVARPDVSGFLIQGSIFVLSSVLPPTVIWIAQRLKEIFQNPTQSKVRSTSRLLSVASTISVVLPIRPADSANNQYPGGGSRNLNLEQELVQLFDLNAGFEVVGVLALMRIQERIFPAGLVLDLLSRPICRALSKAVQRSFLKWKHFRRRRCLHPLPTNVASKDASKSADIDCSDNSSPSFDTLQLTLSPPQFLKDVLFENPDPLKDLDIKAALYSARITGFWTALLFFTIDSPLAAPSQRDSETCQRRLTDSTVWTVTFRILVMLGAHVFVDVLALFVRARIKRRERESGVAEVCAGDGPQVFASLWAIVIGALRMCEFACSAVMFLRGSLLLDPCGP